MTERLQRPSVRLLTLVGPGGIGKTRLALDLAARLLPHFLAGVFFVSLAAIRQADLLPSAIAQALQLPETGERTALAALTAWLPGRRVLLVLDNFEQLLAATPIVIELLQAAADLTILVTSREPLHVLGEHQFRLLPLPVPAAQRLPALALDSLAQYPAVALFCARAEAVQFDFALTAENATGVVEVCRRLDGSPLAIELAAARVAELGVAEIARRLDDRFRLLSEGNRGAPARQQTLRASIAWSYDLLAASDRHLLDTLAVFAGGWTLPAAAAVAGDAGFAPAAVEAGVRRLVDKSLVVAAADADRYTMHESIREYCSDRVQEAGATNTLRTRHLQYFTAWAEAAERHLVGPDQGRWLDQLQGEHDNLRAALSWLPDPSPRGHAQSELVLRLSGALWRFWLLRGHITEGRQRLEAVLAAGLRQGPGLTPTDHPPLLPEQRPLLLAWCKVLMGAGALAYEQGDYAGSRSYLEQHLAGRRALGEAKGLAAALNNLAQTVKAQGDLAHARRLAEESLALKRDLGDALGIANSLGTLGNIACDQADYPAARALYEESLALGREAGDRQGVVTKLNNLGNMLLETQDYAGAQALYEESLTLAQELADQPGMARALGNLGRVAADQGQYRRALTLQQGSLEHFQQAGSVREISENLADLALIGGALGWGVAAVRLLGAAEAVRRATHYRLTPADQGRSERGLIQLRAAIPLAPHEWAAAYSAG
ncbi:MAG: tetratricopeptide repeat protein, partial [Candidatus Dormibacteraeota bacterium]|nr:tetratricopeptide repeat protein [Candidatus Dormibacteraeota bacterium]